MFRNLKRVKRIHIGRHVFELRIRDGLIRRVYERKPLYTEQERKATNYHFTRFKILTNKPSTNGSAATGNLRNVDIFFFFFGRQTKQNINIILFFLIRRHYDSDRK